MQIMEYKNKVSTLFPIADMYGPPNESVFTGGRLDESSVWVWDSTGETVTYTNWAEGEPSGNAGETVIELNQWKNYMWNDQMVTDELHYICEKDN